MTTDLQPFAKYKPGNKVHGRHPKDVIDRAIAIPEELRSKDGRLFHIRGWHSDMSVGGGVEVTGTFLVSLPKEKQS